MRIAILVDAYLPEGVQGHAKMLHDLAVELASRNHSVVVISPGYIKQPDPITRFELNRVEVWKFRCRPVRGTSRIRRAINESLLSWAAYRAISQSKFDSRFDLVINYAPSIFFGPLARWLRGKGAFVYLVLRDFFPQWAVDEGLIKSGSLVERYFRFFERLNYKASDVIGVQSPANLPVFEQIVWPRHFQIEVLYNWAAPLPMIDDSFGRSFIESLCLDEKFIFFYGGNIGHAQDIPYILRLAASLRAYDGIHFLIVGQGAEYKEIDRKIVEMGLKNTTLAPSVSQDEYRSLLTQVDVGMFTLASSHRAHNFPGKILGYLAQGLPILGAVNGGNDLIEIVNKAGAGRVTVNGDYERLVQDAVLIYKDAAKRKTMSRNSRGLLVSQFSVAAAADQLLARTKNKTA